MARQQKWFEANKIAIVCAVTLPLMEGLFSFFEFIIEIPENRAKNNDKGYDIA